METKELTLDVVETKYNECLGVLGKSESKDKTREEFLNFYSQQAFKFLIEGLDHIESVKRAQKRMAELPNLIEAKNKEIEALSAGQNPDYHKKEIREQVKTLSKELENLENETKTFPDDIKHRLMQADLSFKNFDFNMERIELVKKLV
jgi:seryl-tRNA synthetase